MSKGNNVSIFENTMRKATQAISGIIDTKMISLSDMLLDFMIASKTYTGFTGNTQRSYSVGYFLDGDFRYFANAGGARWKKPEIRKKVRKGEKAFLSKPYEGTARAVTGLVDVDDYYGVQTAMDYIASQPKLQSGFTIIAGVGTEYQPLIQGTSMQEMLRENAQYFFNIFVRQVQGASKILT